MRPRRLSRIAVSLLAGTALGAGTLTGAAVPASADVLVYSANGSSIDIGGGATMTIRKLEIYRDGQGGYYPSYDLSCQTSAASGSYNYTGALSFAGLTTQASDSTLKLYDSRDSFKGRLDIDGTFSPGLSSGSPQLTITYAEGCRSGGAFTPQSVGAAVAPPKPVAFTGCTATATSTGIDVTWPGQSGVSGYTVTSNPSSKVVKTGTATTTSLPYASLTADTSYTFTVNGTDGNAGVTCTTSAVRTLPGAPTGSVSGFGAITQQGSQEYQQATLTMPAPPAGFDAVWYSTATPDANTPPQLLGANSLDQWVCGSSQGLYPAYVSRADPALISVGPVLTITPPCTVPAAAISNAQLDGALLTFGYDVATGTADGIVFQYRTTTAETKKASAWTSLPSAAPGSTGGSATVRISGINAPEAATLELRAANGPKSGASVSEVVAPQLPGFSYRSTTFPTTGNGNTNSFPTNPRFDHFADNSVLRMPATGMPGLRFSLDGSTLPKGMKLDPKTGFISGDPGQAMVLNVGVVMTYRYGSVSTSQTATANITFVDRRPPDPKSITMPDISGVVAMPLGTITPSVGSGLKNPRYFYVDQVICDAGLTFNPRTGAISGTPATTLPRTTARIWVSPDGPGGCATTLPGRLWAKPANFSLTIGGNPALSLFQLRYAPAGQINATLATVYNETGSVGSPMTITPTVYPRGQAATFSVTNGVLPAGLALDANTGNISGTPTTPVSGSQVTITATRTTDASGGPLPAAASGTTTAVLAFTINQQSVTPALAYPNVTVQAGHQISVSPSGATAGYTFALDALSLARGMTIDMATGRVTWLAPLGSVGTQAVTVSETSSGTPVDVTFTITVTPAPGSHPSGSTVIGGVVFDGGNTGGGGASSNSRGSGRGVGACIAPDGSMFSDVVGSVGSSLAINPNLTNLPNAVSFAVTAGTLPMGVYLDTTLGTLWGTPELSNGGYGPVQISATFVDGTVRSSAFNIAVDDPHHAINYPVLVRGMVGEPITVTPVPLHPAGKQAFSIVCGALPDGLTLNAKTGVISGTPTAPFAGTVPIRVRMTDDYGWVEGSLDLKVLRDSRPWLRYPDYARVPIGEKATVLPVTSGLTDLARFGVEGELPPGYRFDSRTGAFTGKGGASDGIVYEPTVTAYRADGSVIDSTWVSINIVTPTVPLDVVSRKAGFRVPANKRTTVVSKVRHPAWTNTTTKVTCGKGCTAKVNKRTGKVVISGSKKGARVTVTVIARVKPSAKAKYSDYLAHGWRMSWRVH